MRKEVLLAVIIGLIFGLIITFGIYQANQAGNQSPINANTNTPIPSPTPENLSLVTLLTPDDGQIYSTPSATLKGQTQPGAYLAILTENDELFPVIQDNQFSQDITLIPGANLIQITAITTQNQRQDIKLNLVYTITKFE